MSPKAAPAAKRPAKRPAKQAAPAKNANALLFNFRPEDTLTSVTRESLKMMSDSLGLTETQTVHFALAKLRREVLPRYELDDGPVSEATLKAIRRLVPQDDFAPTQSLFARR